MPSESGDGLSESIDLSNEFDDNHSKEKSKVNLHKEVMDIFEKLQTYMEHVKKNLQDMIPKACTLYIIKKLVEYIRHDVLYHLTTIPCDDNVSIALFPPHYTYDSKSIRN